MPKVLSKVVKQVSISVVLLLHGFPDVVDTKTVLNEFNETAVIAGCKDLVGPEFDL